MFPNYQWISGILWESKRNISPCYRLCVIFQILSRWRLNLPLLRLHRKTRRQRQTVGECVYSYLPFTSIWTGSVTSFHPRAITPELPTNTKFFPPTRLHHSRPFPPPLSHRKLLRAVHITCFAFQNDFSWSTNFQHHNIPRFKWKACTTTSAAEFCQKFSIPSDWRSISIRWNSVCSVRDIWVGLGELRYLMSLSWNSSSITYSFLPM